MLAVYVKRAFGMLGICIAMAAVCAMVSMGHTVSAYADTSTQTGEMELRYEVVEQPKTVTAPKQTHNAADDSWPLQRVFPQTGDSAPIAYLLIGFGIVSATIAVVVLHRRRNEYKR